MPLLVDLTMMSVALTVDGMILTVDISCTGKLLVEFIQHCTYYVAVCTPAAQPDSASLPLAAI